MDVSSVVRFKQDHGLQCVNSSLVNNQNQIVKIDAKGDLYNEVPQKIAPSKNCFEQLWHQIKKIMNLIIHFFKRTDSKSIQENRLLKLADYFFENLRPYKDMEKLDEEKKLELKLKLEAYEPIRFAALAVWEHQTVKVKTPSMYQFEFVLRKKVEALLT